MKVEVTQLVKQLDEIRCAVMQQENPNQRSKTNKAVFDLLFNLPFIETGRVKSDKSKSDFHQVYVERLYASHATLDIQVEFESRWLNGGEYSYFDIIYQGVHIYADGQEHDKDGRTYFDTNTVELVQKFTTKQK